MNIAIILAGGSGKRFGSDIPKQFLDVKNKPVLAYTIDLFEKNPLINSIVIVSNKDWIDKTKTIVEKFKYTKILKICEGGSTFLLSVLNGLKSLADFASKNDIVCVCFGCAPLTPIEDINDSIMVAQKNGNGIASCDISLCTCEKTTELFSSKNVIRETLKGFSNPWSFRYGEVVELYQKAISLNILNKIEQHTTSLYFEFGKKIFFSRSTTPQVKITTKNDLDFFEFMIETKGKNNEQS